jgi:hypothetical protein
MDGVFFSFAYPHYIMNYVLLSFFAKREEKKCLTPFFPKKSLNAFFKGFADPPF